MDLILLRPNMIFLSWVSVADMAKACCYIGNR